MARSSDAGPPAKAYDHDMNRFVSLLLLGMGLLFLTVGGLVGVVGARYARAEVARLERLSPLSAAALEDQPRGADALVEGVVSARNPAVFRDFVAYVREELDVGRDSDGDRTETWRSDGRETPRLLLEAGGLVTVGNEGYSIARGHETWYDESTLGFNRQWRDGSVRYHGLVAGGPITAVGTVIDGPEGNELNAATLFAGTREQYLESQRQGAAFMPIFGGIFGAVGLLLAAVGAVLFARRWA
jgi:hypothetical protein